MKMYIDTKNSYIVKISGYFSMGSNTMVLSAEFSDFRRGGGGKTIFPFRINNFAAGQMIAETDIEEYKINPEQSDSLFMPSSK